MSDQQPPSDPQQPDVPGGAQPPAGGQPPVPPPPPMPPVPPPPPPAQPVAQPAQPYGQPYGQPAAPVPGYAAPGYQQVPQQNQNATIAFVLALVSWVVCPIVAAVVALVFASKAGKEIEQSGGWQTGSGFVTAAKIIAWINIVVSILFIIFYIIFIIFIVAAGTTIDNLPSYTPYITPSGFSG